MVLWVPLWTKSHGEAQTRHLIILLSYLFFGLSKFRVELSPPKFRAHGLTGLWTLHLRVCRPAREPKTGEPPKSAPESALGSALRNRGAPTSAPESALEGALPVVLRRTSPRESTLGSTRGSTPTSESTPESTLGSTFGGFPVLGSLAGRQTLNTSCYLRSAIQINSDLTDVYHLVLPKIV